MNAYQELINNRIIFLNSSINPESANYVVANLLHMNSKSKEDPIEIYINSPGGSVRDGLSIIDTMKILEAPIHTTCLGLAASMGAWILAAGDKGFRRATLNSEIMIHQLSTQVAGDVTYLKDNIQRAMKLQEKMVSMFKIFTGQTEDKIKKDIERDFYLSPEEALLYGIIDEILPPNKI